MKRGSSGNSGVPGTALRSRRWWRGCHPEEPCGYAQGKLRDESRLHRDRRHSATGRTSVASGRARMARACATLIAILYSRSNPDVIGIRRFVRQDDNYGRVGLHRAEDGLVTLEHLLIMAAFVLPMYVVMRLMLQRLGEYYGQLVFFGSLPFF
jgi:hypothetical protein